MSKPVYDWTYDQSRCPCGQVCRFDIVNGACEPTCPCGGKCELIDGPFGDNVGRTDDAVGSLTRERDIARGRAEREAADAAALRRVNERLVRENDELRKELGR